MAAKKTKKKSAKKVVLTENQKEELATEGELPKNSIVKKETKQLIWFFVVVAIVFASFLVPYFWIESTKDFQYGGIDWVVEEYAEPVGSVYHGRFLAFNRLDLFFNIFQRIDPRENDVSTEGTFDDFWSKGIISLSPEVDTCRGQLSRVILDLSSFLTTGVGLPLLESGSTDEDVANQTKRIYADCDAFDDRTIVIIDIGDPAVIKDEENPSCYRIYAENCNDVSSVEKFIFKATEDFVLA